MYSFSRLFRSISTFSIRKTNYWVRNGSLKDKEGSKIKEGREKVLCVCKRNMKGKRVFPKNVGKI